MHDVRVQEEVRSLAPREAMSAELYRSGQTHGPDGSRIPVASPSYGFRRCSSMRLRGERPCTLRIRGAAAVPAGAAPSAVATTTTSDQRHQQTRGEATSGAAVARRPPPLAFDQHDQPGSGSGSGSGSRTRSLSLSLSTPRLSGGSPRPAGRCRREEDDNDDDLDSLRSYASGASTASCEHPFVAHNGTTFSGRRMRYVVHCSAHAGQTGEDYLTPTQRAQRQIRRLKQLLQAARRELDQKDSDILRLTKEVVELRLCKAAAAAAAASPDSSEAVTVRENEDMKTPDSPTCTDFTDDPKTETEERNMQSSYADSGHFEDLNTSKDSVSVQVQVQQCDKACLARLELREERAVAEQYERRLEELVRAHSDQTHDLKHRHNEKVEELLQKLSEVNMRYCQVVPDGEQARERIQELERQLDEVTARLQEQERHHQRVYQQLSGGGGGEEPPLAGRAGARVSVAELLQQLQVTRLELDNIKDTEFTSPQAQSLLSAKEAVSLWVLGARKAMYRRLVETRSPGTAMDPEITLQFLKSAVYYFLTDKENNQGHLKAIQSILGFTPQEISNIERARSS